MSDRSSRIRSALLAVDWIAGAGEEVVEALALSSRWVHLRKDEALFDQGQTFLYIAVIASGFIESSLLSRDGRQCMTSLMGKGQILGFNALFLERPAQGTHVATENTEVVLVPGDILLAEMQRSAVLMRGVLREQSRRIEHLSYLLVDRQLQSHRVRIARTLIMLWAYYEPRQVKVIPESGATFIYLWGDKMIEHHTCRTCGCTTHWTPVDKTYPRMGVNARMMELEVLAAAKVRHSPGPD